MGWTISTYSGLKANGPAGNWRVGMFELCRAVNERQGAIGATKTQFYKGDGTQGADLAFSDFLGLKTSGASSKVETNLTRIQTAIKAMAAGPVLGAGDLNIYFHQSAGNTSVWSVAAMEFALGASFLSAPESATDAAYWQQLKDALDLLIYPSMGAFADYGYYDLRNVTGTYATYQDIWDAVVADTPTNTNSGPTGLKYSAGDVFAPPGPDTALIYDNCDFSLDLADFVGTVEAVGYNYTITGSLVSSPTVTIGSSSFTAPSSSGQTAGDPSDITLGTTTNLTMDIPTTPTTIPISGPGSWGMDLDSVTLYLDISSELTDQT